MALRRGTKHNTHTRPPSPLATLRRLSSRLFGATLFASQVPPWGPLARCEGVVSTRMRSPRNDNAHSFPFPPILFCYRFCPEEKRCGCAFTTTSGRSEWWSRHPTSSLHYHVQQDAGKKSQPVGTAHWAASRADVSRLSGGLLGVSHSGSWEAHSHPAGGAHNRLRPDSWRN